MMIIWGFANVLGVLGRIVVFLAMLPVRMVAQASTWRRNAMYLHELERMDPRLLKDIGYRRDEVVAAIREGRQARMLTDQERLEEARQMRLARERRQQNPRAETPERHLKIACKGCRESG
ncbi:DUF1127 domain-containing protein [Oceanidesulfovibrio marinus]|uniref:DUF1127 domain-containing protein n=1 Tax=Oceanidesulfovibrio marinus TaxID=370038 RepID=A0ABX6NDU4_9BACT|nr:DUF1127 domain-containing protein [Oceanidesulfovibrio marinus]QJT08764.1 DUF1127 domain-containing protein [Oceanidesulfovibrio marinus]